MTNGSAVTPATPAWYSANVSNCFYVTWDAWTQIQVRVDLGVPHHWVLSYDGRDMNITATGQNDTLYIEPVNMWSSTANTSITIAAVGAYPDVQSNLSITFTAVFLALQPQFTYTVDLPLYVTNAPVNATLAMTPPATAWGSGTSQSFKI